MEFKIEIPDLVIEKKLLFELKVIAEDVAATLVRQYIRDHLVEKLDKVILEAIKENMNPKSLSAELDDVKQTILTSLEKSAYARAIRSLKIKKDSLG